ncbi:MAG TPA: hypothetical protein VMF11_14745 [Candidatus Baltobacteraceae bacterium]|nr:hypothetical protein [Candidatus Baltobacteraceae bacterium]
MGKTAAFGLAVFMTGAFVLTAGAVEPSLANSSTAVRLRSLAAKHDVRAIEAMRSEVAAANWPALSGLYHVELFLAGKKNDDEDFIRNYPWRQIQEICVAFTDTGPVRALETLVKRRGDVPSIRLLFLSHNHSDGFVAETLSGALRVAAARFPGATLAALRALPPDEQPAATSCYSLSDIRTPEMFSLPPRDAADARLLRAIRAAIPGHC